MLEPFLINWARWCRWGSVGPIQEQSCASAEKLYLWLLFDARHQFDEKPTYQAEPNERWGAFVEHEVRQLPDYERRAIRVEYVLVRPRANESPDQYAERKRRSALMPAWYYIRCVDSARGKVAERLLKSKEFSRIEGGIVRPLIS